MHPTFDAHIEKLKALCPLPDRPAAQNAFNEALKAAREPWQFRQLWGHVRLVFPKWRLPFVFTSLLDAASAIGDNGAEMLALKLRAMVAMRDFNSFSQTFDEKRSILEADGEGLWAQRFERLESVLRRPRFPDLSAPKVFGIGLSRTGTMSLTTALRRLGYFTSHFDNEFSMQMLEPEDAFIFDAMTDTPVCISFEMLYHRFENARFVWTTQPFERWEASLNGHLTRIFGTSDFHMLRKCAETLQHKPEIYDFKVLDGSLYLRYGDLHEAHRAYCQRVEHFFSDKPADKLLILETGSGEEWSRLCRFLGHDIPDEPYPWDNNSGLRA